MTKKVIVFMLMFSFLFANTAQETTAPVEARIDDSVNWCHVLRETKPSDPDYIEIWEMCACQQAGCL